MCARVDEDKFKNFFVLSPNQEPVRFKMTLPAASIIAYKAMSFVLWGQCASCLKNVKSVGEGFNVESSFRTFLQ